MSPRVLHVDVVRAKTVFCYREAIIDWNAIDTCAIAVVYIRAPTYL